MSYVSNNLIDGEEILQTTRLHWLLFLNPFLVFLGAVTSQLFLDTTMMNLISQFLCAIVLIMLVQSLFYFYFTEIVVTNKRIIVKTGFFTINTNEILFKKVESIDLEQNIIDRMFSRGNVKIKGTGDTHMNISGILNPVSFKNKVLSLL